MLITDPKSISKAPFFLKPAVRLLNDPRDVAFLSLMLQCLGMACLGVALFFIDVPLLYAAPVYFAILMFGLLDRFTLMLHCTSHRPLFKKKYRALNHVIPWLLGPFFGQTPSTYFAHHMAMHHREENLQADLSSTMRFKRDRLDHWLRYCGRFFFIGLVELVQYLSRKRQSKLVTRVAIGEGLYWSAILALLIYSPSITLLVFVGPLVLIRTLMMMGNWAQHSFVCDVTPEDPYRAAITCINTRYNRRCFNDGYHTLHHVRPSCHWTDHPVEFERNLHEYAKHDAIVFDGLDYFQVWLCLMLRRWSTLAESFVILPGAPTRSHAQIIAFLQQRVMPIGVAVSETDAEVRTELA